MASCSNVGGERAKHASPSNASELEGQGICWCWLVNWKRTHNEQI